MSTLIPIVAAVAGFYAGLAVACLLVAAARRRERAELRRLRTAVTIPAQRRAQVVAAHPAGGRDRDAWTQISGQTATITRIGKW